MQPPPDESPVSPGPQPRPPGPSLRLAIAVMVVGAALAIPTAVLGALPVVRTFTTSHRVAVPGAVHLHLAKSTFTVYEQTGRATIGSAFSPDDTVTITPADVTVIDDATGATVPVRDRGDTTETLTDGGDRFVGAVRFTTPAAGDYTIEVRSSSAKSVLVGRSLGASLGTALKWFALAALGALVFVAGLVMLIVGTVRRSRARDALAYASAYFAPPGWHPDPWGSGRLRYWDGARWTEHLH